MEALERLLKDGVGGITGKAPRSPPMGGPLSLAGFLPYGLGSGPRHRRISATYGDYHCEFAKISSNGLR